MPKDVALRKPEDATMTTFAINRAATGSASGFFTSLMTAVGNWNDARVTRNALSKLSDRELDDIGLCRGDIDGIAPRA